jgi:hypothetical protein
MYKWWKDVEGGDGTLCKGPSWVLLLWETQHDASIYSANRATPRPTSPLTHRKICGKFGATSEYSSSDLRSLFTPSCSLLCWTFLIALLTGFVCESYIFVCFWRDSPHWAWASSFKRFLDHTQRRITAGRTPLDEWSARRRDLYPTTHKTHNRQTSMPPVGFEFTISAGDRPQTDALHRRGRWDRRNLYTSLSEK